MSHLSYKGYRDVPVEGLQDDILEVRVYIESLSDFILECDTPMTIAIQGDWGSGKTSMMNMIREQIQGNVIPIWFNTWQFSQFEMQSFLAISLLNNFLEELGEQDFGKRIMAKIGRGFLNVAKGAMVVATEKVVGETIAGNVNDAMGGGPAELAQEVKELKSRIEKAVQERLKKENKSRLVVFIDDLDRLAPEKAVELLEVLKLFLDVPNCIFVLAVDYAVVMQGLEKKFGKSVGDVKGKSFFDKIIQLPFTVPVAQYNVENYIKSLLERMHINIKSEDLWLYQELINSSIGFNPRSMKRLFNSYLLLNNVAVKKKIFEDQRSKISREDKQRILFATLCLQMAFDAVYHYMLQNLESVDDTFFGEIKNIEEFKKESVLADIKREIKDNQDIMFNRISNFMEAFYAALQLDNKTDTLSAEEVNNLKSILSFSSITSVTKETISAPKIDSSSFLSNCNAEDKQYYQKIFDYLKSNGDGFKLKFGTAGFSINGIILCYPTSFRKHIEILNTKVTPGIKAFIQNKGGDLGKQRSHFAPQNLSTDDMIKILEMMKQPE